VGEVADGLLVADDGAVRAALGQEMTRLKVAEPAAALGVCPDASGEEIRARFLALVKVYHPNRFARRPPDIVKLANEVFLQLRRAYQRVGERPPVADASGSTGGNGGNGGNGAARAAAVAARASEISPATQPRLDVDAALARRRRARSQPIITPVTGAIPPPPASPTSPIEVVEKGRRGDEEREQRLQAALVDLRQGRLPSARAALRALVAESPSNRGFRAHLHHVTGRMHESAGRLAEALVEYDRALGFDPDLEEARRSREQLRGSGPPGAAGRFSRWFRK